MKSAPESDFNLLMKTVDKMLEYNTPNNKILENMDEVFKYFKRMDKATKLIYKDVLDKIFDALNFELKFSLAKNNFSCSKATILPIVEDIAEHKIDISDALRKISLAKWKIF